MAVLSGGSSSVSSPLSTGGAGTLFERDVNAYWLAQLLLKWIPPILIDATVVEVSFQTEHLGWHTDDVLVTCEGASGVRSRLAGQVKRTFTVSAADEDCQKAILDFWKDFKNPALFSARNDRFVLIVQRGSDVLLGAFGRLLECARGSRDGPDFAHRLLTPGFVSKKAVHYAGVIATIVGAHEGRAVDPAELWPFLSVLYLLSLDLDTSTRQAEVHVRGALAYTAPERDGQTIASASWSALQRLAESSMKEARTFARVDLPEDLQRAHGSLGTTENKILKALRDHSEPTLRKIRSTIGPTFHLPRPALVELVLDQLQGSQVVIISGAAGSGKSAVGKEVLTRLGADHFTFAFRAEEFAKAHIDETLQAAQVPGNAVALAAVLAAQGRKIVLIESMERLLERSTRDAFSDLITRAVEDPGLHLVITCRDYSTEQVRESFLREPGLTQTVVIAPPLEDSELDAIAAGLPPLSRPLSHPPLRSILRNPYFLDKALDIPWPPERPLPESEREFRRYFWRHLVRTEGAHGLGRRREQVLEEVAIRRARALSEYIPLADLDPAVAASLKADSLIVSPDGEPSLIATAHDVLEDWAILEWFEEQHLAEAASFAELAAAIGTHPAIRRSYRKWVTELLEREPAAADRLFLAATTDVQQGAQFRDDTLVSILRAPLASGLLARHESELVADHCVLLKRVIQLLRVACVGVADWARELREYGSAFNVPEGAAWPAVLEIVHDNWRGFSDADQPLLLGLIEDAVRGIAWWAPEAPGEPFVAGIAYALLPTFGGWRSDDARERLLKIIAKIPKADPESFEAALRGTSSEDRRERDPVAEALQELLLTGMEGMPAVRDLPRVMVSVASDYLLATEEELRRDTYRHYSTDIDIFFGIRDGHRHDFFPASAFRGPWLPLLQCHPGTALKFYYQVFDHSIDWYVHPRVPDPLEPAWEAEITFADGTAHKQWVNARLWNAYRGISVCPYVLQSMLMALEKWLLEVATRKPQQLDKVLLAILGGTQSASLSAVAASVAIAHPDLTGEALLVLLSAPDYVRLDRQRMAQESGASALTNMLPQLLPDKKLYDDERRQSNALPHRGRDLEFAISSLQFGPLRERVHSLLDQHTAALPEPEMRSREDLLWELALKRMDLRQYNLGEPVTVPAAAAAGESSAEPPKTYVPLELKPLGAAVQALVDEGTASQATMSKSLTPWMWAIRVLKGEATPEQQLLWRERLTMARDADRDTEDEIGTRNGPGCVAAVCVRDYWGELTAVERTWCTNVVCSEIMRTANLWTDIDRIQRHDMAADRRCAGVVAGLLTKVSSEAERTQVRQALAAALTHPNQEVNWYAASSVDTHVWQVDRVLALKSANTIALHAERIEKRWEQRERREWTPKEAAALFKDIADEVRAAFQEAQGIPEEAYSRVNLEARAGADAYGRILTILAFAPADPATVCAFERASIALVEQWDEKRRDRGRERRRDFESELATKKRIQEFALRAPPEQAERVLRPIIAAVDRNADEIDSIVHGLTIEEDRRSNPAQYWYVWDLFAAAVKRASWLKWLDREHPTGDKLLAALFMTWGWKESVRHWKTLEGEAHRVDALFEALPRAAVVLDDYLSFLYHIGGNSLPHAFTRVADALRHGGAPRMLVRSNSVFLLEVLLQRHVYGRPLELKRDREVREAVLYLLDALVERGSSAAFRMRDDFVTPAA